MTLRRVRLLGGAALLCAAVPLAGCFPTPPSVRVDLPLGRIDSVSRLLDAYLASGGSCDQREIISGFWAAEIIPCDGDTTLSMFTTTETFEQQLVVYENVGSGLSEYTVLVGENWMLSSNDAAEMQAALGGEVIDYGTG